MRYRKKSAVRTVALGVTLAVVFGLLVASECKAYESLYSDNKASKVGDILTVVIMERTLASNSSKLSTGKETRFGLGGEEGTGALDFIPGFTASADMSREHEGEGSTQRSGSIVGKLAAIVEQVNENGCLVIKGQREIIINDEKEVLVLTGMVRPQDISTGNVVYSTDIANTQITYKGKGQVTSGSKPSIISRIVSLFF
jgi:flagellar L-ring protein precursor FlgH